MTIARSATSCAIAGFAATISGNRAVPAISFSTSRRLLEKIVMSGPIIRNCTAVPRLAEKALKGDHHSRMTSLTFKTWEIKRFLRQLSAMRGAFRRYRKVGLKGESRIRPSPFKNQWNRTLAP
ncbi:exported hypothetical protein [Agrobacterium genomosp. 13 str. CFBP 6927]|uniref:Uncharacterized protein n=1 Tax=Agrobacterium genomosp. 13 str. CFBP 6927 TaxID=1183428 RepID=A0ABM9VFW6_9HYPH|nr:exported hypothetical protein [Agrobacterium genomosp. 13 str. CFBP 6927]